MYDYKGLYYIHYPWIIEQKAINIIIFDELNSKEIEAKYCVAFNT